MAYSAAFDEYRTFGVEIECFGVPRYRVLSALQSRDIACVHLAQTNDVLYTWRLSDDGSIRGEHAVEVVSPPLCGREGLAELGKVLGILQQIDCEVNYSCGFHVHWNCGDFTGQNVLSLLNLYAKYEPVIDYLVSPSRRGNANDHCRSLLKQGTDMHSGAEWIESLNPNGKLRAAEVSVQFERVLMGMEYHLTQRRSSRYHKVNVSAYNLYGTIEFRQHQGTVSADKAVYWTIFTQMLVNKAKQIAVGNRPAAKCTLGELLRTLGMLSSKDELVGMTREWLKERYRLFRQDEDSTESLEAVTAVERERDV